MHFTYSLIFVKQIIIYFIAVYELALYKIEPLYVSLRINGFKITSNELA